MPSVKGNLMAIKKKRNGGAQMHPAVLLSVEHPTNVLVQTKNQGIGFRFILSGPAWETCFGKGSASALRIGRGSVFLKVKPLDLGLLGNTHTHDKFNRGKHRCRKGKGERAD